jgi:tetratricopeptide (TPR) repeat protein
MTRTHSPDDGLRAWHTAMDAAQEATARRDDRSAERLYLAALTEAERLGDDEGPLGETLEALGELYAAFGRFADAEARFRQALAVQERARGPAHPAVALALNNLAALDARAGRTADAQARLERAVAI